MKNREEENPIVIDPTEELEENIAVITTPELTEEQEETETLKTSFKRIFKMANPMFWTQVVRESSMIGGYWVISSIPGDQKVMLAIAALAINTQRAILYPFDGPLEAVNILAGYAFGEANEADENDDQEAKEIALTKAGTIFQVGKMLTIPCAIIPTILMLTADKIFVLTGQHNNISEPAGKYFSEGLWFGAFPMFLLLVTQQFVNAAELAYIPTIVNIVTLPIVLGGGYWLAHGGAGIRPVGTPGFGIAFATQAWINDFMLDLWTLLHPKIRPTRSLSCDNHPNKKAIVKELIKLGKAISLQNCSELFSTTVMTWLASYMNGIELAATGMASSWLSFGLIPLLALQETTAALVSILLGEDKQNLIHRYTMMTGGGTTLAMFLFTIISLIFPKLLASPFLDVNNPANAEIFERFCTLAPLYLGGLCFDAGRLALIGAQRGRGDVNRPMWISALWNWLVALPLQYLTGFVFKWKMTGVVAVRAVVLLAGEIHMLFRFSRYKAPEQPTEEDELTESDVSTTRGTPRTPMTPIAPRIPLSAEIPSGEYSLSDSRARLFKPITPTATPVPDETPTPKESPKKTKAQAAMCTIL